MSTQPTHGGPRPGAGRPRKGEQPRVTISFSVDQSTRDKARKLRKAGFELNAHIEGFISDKYAWYFNNDLAYELRKQI